MWHWDGAQNSRTLYPCLQHKCMNFTRSGRRWILGTKAVSLENKSQIASSCIQILNLYRSTQSDISHAWNDWLPQSMLSSTFLLLESHDVDVYMRFAFGTETRTIAADHISSTKPPSAGEQLRGSLILSSHKVKQLLCYLKRGIIWYCSSSAYTRIEIMMQVVLACSS